MRGGETMMDGALWVFGYGSLMWRPGFPHRRTLPALLKGAHRSLCVYSWVHRGTQQQPGLVLGLDRGGACRGLAFEVEPADRAAVIDNLRAREQVTMVYREVMRPVRIADAGGIRVVDALVYVVDRRHPQYAGVLTMQQQLDLVRGGRGLSGPNPDYVLSTVDHLRSVGIRDAGLYRLADALRSPAARDHG